MKKNKQSKWFALVILLCISIGAKAQMPQTPQDILNMAAGSLQFDFSGYFNGQQQQQKAAATVSTTATATAADAKGSM